MKIIYILLLTIFFVCIIIPINLCIVFCKKFNLKSLKKTYKVLLNQLKGEL